MLFKETKSRKRVLVFKKQLLIISQTCFALNSLSKAYNMHFQYVSSPTEDDIYSVTTKCNQWTYIGFCKKTKKY